MDIKVEVVAEPITSLALVVYGDKLVVYIPKNIAPHEVIFLVSSLLNQESHQMLKMVDSEKFITIRCDAIDTTEIDSVVLKVEPHSDYVSAFGQDSIIDIFISEFTFNETN